MNNNCIPKNNNYLIFFNPPIIITFGTPLEFPHITSAIIYENEKSGCRTPVEAKAASALGL